MSTLKVNKLRDTAGSADAITLDPNGGAVLAGVTTVSTVKVGSGVTISSDGDVFTTGITTSSTVIVGSGVTISESGIEASGIGITCANINGAQIGGRRNLIFNGAMQVAQRGTSSTSTGYNTVDRFSVDFSGLDENLTQAQVDVASGTTPYTSGFRKAFKITNGNQTGGADNADYANIQYKFEAQDISNSGWNYISSSSNITISFWVKSSVAQTFHAYLRTKDGTNYHYPISFALSADTWTKVTKTISGNSNLQIDNDNGEGMQFTFMLFYGTNYTDSGATLNAWQATSGGTAYSPDNTTTWYTTNDATFEITGLQLEVGSQATAFEHRSLAEELSLCQRYFYMHASGAEDASNGGETPIGLGYGYTSTDCYVVVKFPVTMRSNPSMLKVVGSNYFRFAYNNNNSYPDNVGNNRVATQSAEIYFYSNASWDQNAGGMVRINNTAARLGFDAEL